MNALNDHSFNRYNRFWLFCEYCSSIQKWRSYIVYQNMNFGTRSLIEIFIIVGLSNDTRTKE